MTNTQQSVRDMGEKHAREKINALPRSCFDSDEFYRIYMEGYNSYRPSAPLPDPIYDYRGIPFYPSGSVIRGSGTYYTFMMDPINVRSIPNSG